MKRAYILTLIVVLAATIAAQEIKDEELNQIFYTVRLFHYNLTERTVTKLIETRLCSIAGETAKNELKKGMGVPHTVNIKGDIISVDEIKKVIIAEVDLSLASDFEISLHEIMYLYRGERKRLTVFSDGPDYLVLEMEAVFSCYECPGASERAFPEEDVVEPIELVVTVLENESGHSIIKKKIKARHKRPGNLRVERNGETLMLDIEAESKGDYCTIGMRAWRVREENRARTTFHETYEMVLFPDEKQALTVEGGDMPLLVTLQLAEKEGFFRKSRDNSFRIIGSRDFAEKMKKRTLKPKLIDVRTDSEFDQGHLNQALNIDYYSPSLLNKLKKLAKENIYIIYSRKEAKASAVMKQMLEMGFDEVYVLKGGWESREDYKDF